MSNPVIAVYICKIQRKRSCWKRKEARSLKGGFQPEPLFIGSLTETDVDHTGIWSRGMVHGNRISPLGGSGCRKMLNDAENTGSVSPTYLKDGKVNLGQTNTGRGRDGAHPPATRPAFTFLTWADASHQ